MNYKQAKEIFETSRKRKLTNNTHLEKNEDGSYAIRLHMTQIIKFYPEKTVLDSGGYRTVTTKARINEFTDFYLQQKDGIWYVGISSMHFTDYKVFADNLEFNIKTRKWTGIGENPKRITKLRKQAKRYAKDFTKALFAGKVPKPNGGDCWYCLLTVTSPTKDAGRALGEVTHNNHIVSHFKDRYYVPNLLVRATKMFSISSVAEDCIARLWNNEPVHGFFADVGKVQIESAIRRYCYRQLQTA